MLNTGVLGYPCRAQCVDSRKDAPGAATAEAPQLAYMEKRNQRSGVTSFGRSERIRPTARETASVMGSAVAKSAEFQFILVRASSSVINSVIELAPTG